MFMRIKFKGKKTTTKKTPSKLLSVLSTALIRATWTLFWYAGKSKAWQACCVWLWLIRYTDKCCSVFGEWSVAVAFLINANKFIASNISDPPLFWNASDLNHDFSGAVINRRLNQYPLPFWLHSLNLGPKKSVFRWRYDINSPIGGVTAHSVTPQCLWHNPYKVVNEVKWRITQSV